MVELSADGNVLYLPADNRGNALLFRIATRVSILSRWQRSSISTQIAEITPFFPAEVTPRMQINPVFPAMPKECRVFPMRRFLMQKQRFFFSEMPNGIVSIFHQKKAKNHESSTYDKINNTYSCPQPAMLYYMITRTLL